MLSVVWKCALSLCLLAGSAAAWPNAPLATVTIADGEALLTRDASRMQLLEGVRLAKDDIVETTAKTRLVRIEFADGVIVDLGPDTRALLSPRYSAERSRIPVRMGLLRGTVKLSVPPTLDPAAGAFATPAFDVTSLSRSAVFFVSPDEADAFAESGELKLQERWGGKPGSTLTVRKSEFYARGADGKSAVTARPTPAFIQRLPRPFMDTLPARAALYKTREVQPRPIGTISFAEAQDWIAAEGLRPYFVARWKTLARDPAFREGVATNMRAHPEWDRILYPEKYAPRPSTPRPTQAPSPSAVGSYPGSGRP